MWLIRAFEEKVSEMYARGAVRGLIHLGIGQEAVAVGACFALEPDDLVVGGHRSHGHALARGADPERLLAEIAGRASGYCGGKGGSMHIAATDVGFITATGVVGGNVALALGASLTAMSRGGGQVAAVFFGDGAAQTGVFHECLNLASLWRLPLVFVCENNGYAEFTPLSAHTVVAELSAHARTYAMPTRAVDGNDVLAVRDGVRAAAALAREGAGPSFVECITYRLRGHYEGDPAKYRELAELAEWKEKDPVRRYEAVLAERGALGGEDRARIERRARDRVETAASAALAAPFPGPADLMTDVLSRPAGA
ncbi:MAG: thiamine pyrophosphate-dependent dehydrogenase E1 component subunit alpha [Chloroflexi bacterium]|nr:thiamine pyrophosphate-dependent dehydrogenase E1 component subunit alpha [Chloroflexota bacterium]